MVKVFGVSATEDFINKLHEELNYECINTYEGGCGIGDWICIPPDDTRKYVIIREKFLNEWSSGQTVRMYHKLPKKYEKELDDFWSRDD